MRKIMWVMLGCAALTFAVTFGSALCAQEEEKPATTMLFDYENDDDVKACEAKADTETAISTEHATSGKQSLKVTMKAGAEYPGLYIEKFPTKDWSGNAALKFDIFTDEPVTMAMTLKDPKSKSYETRYNNDKISLDKGANTVTITLGDVGAAIDLKTIKSMSLFCHKPGKDVTIYVDNMRLEK